MKGTISNHVFERGDFIVHEFSKIASFKGTIEELREDGAMVKICVNRKKKERNDTEIVFAPYDELRPFRLPTKAV